MFDKLEKIYLNMDVASMLQHSQYAIPVGIVLICAILVFVFGFKNAEQPPFSQLSAASDADRKVTGKKRGKVREKRTANGQIVTEKASPTKKVSPVKAESVKKAVAKTEEVEGKLKERKQESNKPSVIKNEKSPTVSKSGKENKVEQVKNKKNLKNLIQEKPVDFDDGDWEQAYSRKDKKNKKKDEETPLKKNKKTPKKTDSITDVIAKDKDQEKSEIKDKTVKETENKEMKEKNKKEVILSSIISDAELKEEIVEKKEVEKIEKVEEKKGGKSKKGKKISESESTPPPTSEPSTPGKDQVQSEETAEKKEDIKKRVETTEVPTIEKIEEKSPVVFDELGDVWTEAKPQKKSKKKARKDN